MNTRRIRAAWGRLGTAARYFPIVSSIGRDRDPVAGPVEVMVDFCNPCNLHCLCCYNYSPLSPCRFDREERRRCFPADLFVDLMDDCASLGVRYVNLSGHGEPLMHPECERLLGAIGERGLRAIITTNGTLLSKYPKAADLLSYAVISIQAGSREVYERMHPRDGKGNWSRVLDGLRLLSDAAVPTSLVIVVCTENYRDLGAAIDLAGEHGADVTVLPITPFIRKEAGRAEFDPEQTDTLQLTDEHLAELRAEYPALREHAAARGVALHGLDNMLMPPAAGRAPSPQGAEARSSLYDRQPCYAGWYFSRVLMDGSVTPCCQCVGGITLGNIHERSFAKIWRSAECRRSSAWPGPSSSADRASSRRSRSSDPTPNPRRRAPLRAPQPRPSIRPEPRNPASGSKD